MFSHSKNALPSLDPSRIIQKETTNNDLAPMPLSPETVPQQSEGTAFVIMPIRSRDSGEYRHFLSIYEDYIRPVLKHRLNVIRADEIFTPGNITKQVIDLLRSSVIVVADLTDCNPNVFYELGIRHAVTKSGTILLLDEHRTPNIPFDLGAYRVVCYRSDPIGLKALTKGLSDSLNQCLKEYEREKADNPVYDWMENPIGAICQELPDRAAMYRKASELINKAQKHVMDTTWGRDPYERDSDEEEAYKEYISARCSAVVRPVQYHELFSVTEERKNRVNDSHRDSLKTARYRVKKISGIPAKLPMVDFVIVDYRHIIFSNVQANGVERRYLYVQSEQVGKFFKDYYDECWREASPLDPPKTDDPKT